MGILDQINKLVKNEPRKKISAKSWTINQNPFGKTPKAATSNAWGSGPELPDWLQMQMDAADLLYGGGSSGGGGGGGYSVPSIQPQIDMLNDFLAKGQGSLTNTYNQLNTQLNQGVTDTRDLTGKTTANITKGYDDSLAANKQALADLQAQQQQLGMTAGSAGVGASQEAIAALNAEIQRQQAAVEASKASSLANQNTNSQGLVNAAQMDVTAGQQAGANAQTDLLTQVGSAIAGLQSQYQQDQAKAAAANASSRSSAASSGNKAQGKKMQILSKYLEDQDKAAKKDAKGKKEKVPTKGLEAVAYYAQKSGNPELANIFSGLVGEARTLASSPTQATDKNGKPIFNKDGSPKMSPRMNPRDALQQIVDNYAAANGPDIGITSKGKWLGKSPTLGAGLVNPLLGIFGAGDKISQQEGDVLDFRKIGQLPSKLRQKGDLQKQQQQLNNLLAYYYGIGSSF